METPHGRTADHLNRYRELMNEMVHTSLFQAIDALCKLVMDANPDITEEQAFDLILFSGNESLAFPARDIHSIRPRMHKGRLGAEVTLNLLSLSGASSPLPQWWTEAATGTEKSSVRLRQFMDLFNHRIQRLLFQVWQKYRYYASFRRHARDAFSRRVFSLLGLGPDALRRTSSINWQRLLPYLGLLSLRVHSATIIESVLRYYFQHEEIFIEQCRLRSVPIPEDQMAKLGTSTSGLDGSCVIGALVRDRKSKFRIHVRNLSWSLFHTFFPSGKNYPVLNELVRFCLKEPLEYDIQLTLKPNDIQPLELADNTRCQLGWTTWLSHEKSDGTIIISGSF